MIKGNFSLITLLALVVCLLIGCPSPDHSENETNVKERPSENFRFEHKTGASYAKGFSVTYHDNYKTVVVPEPWPGAGQGFKYILVQKGTSPPGHEPDVQMIEIPVENIVCTSTTHIPLLDLLGESKKLAGFPNTDLISSHKVRGLISSGKVMDLGSDKALNIESLIALSPDLVMDFGTGSDFDRHKAIRNAGIPIVINADYLETHPLGRAEWLKYMALFFNKEKQADSVFNAIRQKYMALKALAGSTVDRPTVFSGIVYGDTWFVPGGQNSGAKFIQDAGGEYLWKDSKVQGSLPLSFEAVYEKAHNADFWIGVASFKSLKEIGETDSRYSVFEAFKNGNVYSYNARTGEKGGSTFLELGYARPDIILADLIKILHPELLPEHDLYFYEKLN